MSHPKKKQRQEEGQSNNDAVVAANDDNVAGSIDKLSTDELANFWISFAGRYYVCSS